MAPYLDTAATPSITRLFLLPADFIDDNLLKYFAKSAMSPFHKI